MAQMQFSHSSNAFNIEEFNEFVDQHLNVDLISNDAKQTQQQIQRSQKYIQDLDPDFSLLDPSKQRTIHQSAILQSVYGEYLLQQHCPLLAKSYNAQAEKLYLKLLGIHPDDRYLRYNLGIHYARNSVYFRKNQDSTPRLALLNSAERIQKKLFEQYPKNDNYQTQYYAVLSDKLDLLLERDSQPQEQLQIIHVLKTPLFQMLNHSNQRYDSGNFLILVQQYYRYLYKQNPKNAEDWILSNKQQIELQIKNNQHHDQREHEFLAEFYAMTNQTKKALSHLKHLDPEDDSAPTPSDLEKSIPLANIKLNPKFQTWLKHYTERYQTYLKLHPEQCKLK